MSAYDTALLIFVPLIIAMLIGDWLGSHVDKWRCRATKPREYPKDPHVGERCARHRHSGSIHWTKKLPTGPSRVRISHSWDEDFPVRWVDE